MEIWNREQLYAEIWESPLIKVAPKYGISAVALGKICRKLQIPLPGRGYWAQKEFGKAAAQTPLPEGKDVSVLRRSQINPDASNSKDSAEFSADDPEVLLIIATGKKDFGHYLKSERHALVSRAAKALNRARTDDRGVLVPKGDESILNIRVSKNSLERGLQIINAIILALEEEGFPITVTPNGQTTSVRTLGQDIPFALVERLIMNRTEVKRGSWTDTVTQYRPSGELEFRFGSSGYGWSKKVSDGKIKKLENTVSECVGKLMRHARHLRIEQEKFEQYQAECRKKELEREELARQISEEEKKLKDLDSWVTNWDRAGKIREFVVALRKVWAEQGHDVSPESAKGQKLAWMTQQADRLDPMLESPPSILDRKKELSYW